MCVDGVRRHGHNNTHKDTDAGTGTDTYTEKNRQTQRHTLSDTAWTDISRMLICVLCHELCMSAIRGTKHELDKDIREWHSLLTAEVTSKVVANAKNTMTSFRTTIAITSEQ